MFFAHKPITFPELVEETGEDGGRYYITPEGNRYQSVTTFLKFATDAKELDEWKGRVGDDEAGRLSRMAAQRGKILHEMFEAYLANRPLDLKKIMPVHSAMYRTITPILDQYVTTVHALEAPLYSNVLRLAGRCDFFGEWANQPAIIDFKTAEQGRSRKIIAKYLIQAAAYAYMVEERCGIVVDKLVIILVNMHDHPKVYIRKKNKYIQALLQVRTDDLNIGDNRKEANVASCQ